MLITQKVEELKLKGTIKMAHHTPGTFVSQIFIVPKKDGVYCLVVNLRVLNRFIQEDYFKMDNFHMARKLVSPQDWLVKVDLKDVYLLVPIHPDHHKYLVSMGRSEVPVLLSTIWPLMCSKSFYKTDEASSGLHEGKRNETD